MIDNNKNFPARKKLKSTLFNEKNSRIIFPFFCVLVLLLVNSCSDNKSGLLLSGIKEKAEQYENQAKMNIIRSAAHVYAAEYGRAPQTLDELVEKGYLDKSAIVDKNGKKLPYSPDSILPDDKTAEKNVIKKCGVCGHTVDPNSTTGDRCPYCKVVWNVEKQM